MKRLNRKKLIEQFEELRQGFCSARDLIAKTEVEKISMDAYHRMADKMVVELGGESVRTTITQ